MQLQDLANRQGVLYTGESVGSSKSKSNSSHQDVHRVEGGDEQLVVTDVSHSHCRTSAVLILLAKTQTWQDK